MDPKEIQPEIKDIMEMLDRYYVVNKGNVSIIFVAVAHNEGVCDNCNEHKHDIIEGHTYGTVTHGELGALRVLHNSIRDQIEDNVDEEGYVDYAQVGDDGYEDDEEDEA